MKTKYQPLLILCSLVLLLLGPLACSSADGADNAPDDSSAANDFGEEVDEALLGLKVRTAILEELGTSVFNIDVDTVGTEVTLSGTVEERSTQETAKEIAQAVDGVTEVHNHLQVEASTEDSDTPVADGLANAELEVKDAVLETRIKSKLLAEMGRHGFGIEVEATDGVVSLEGRVPDQTRHDLALKVTGEVKGVNKVVDLLTITA